MTQPPQRSPTPRVIAVTGASGYIGGRLVKRLLDRDDVQRVLAIDIRPIALEHDKLTFVEQDITDPLDELFIKQRVDAVVHLAFMLRQLRNRAESRRINVGGSSNVLWACETAGVRRILLMSSSTVYGAHPDNEGDLDEEAVLRPPSGFSYAADKAYCEWFFRYYAEQRLQSEVSVLRSCVVMGPGVDNFITQALDKPFLIGIGGADPPMQFVHEEDLLNVMTRLVVESHPGVFNIAGPGKVNWSSVVKMGGTRLFNFSAPVAAWLTNMAWRLRLQNDATAAGLDYIRWPWTVSTRKLRAELDYEFEYTSRQALEAYFGEFVD